jgi:hypothetical protein
MPLVVQGFLQYVLADNGRLPGAMSGRPRLGHTEKRLDQSIG